MAAKGCIFCDIAHGKDPKATLLYEDEEVAVFSDHHPKAPHHYLAVSKQHIRDVRSLDRSHIPLVESLVRAGLKVLEEQGGKQDEARCGFHLPPLLWVSHLHLHILSPHAQMGFFANQLFRPDSYWFPTVDSILKKLKEMPEPENTKDVPPETKSKTTEKDGAPS